VFVEEGGRWVETDLMMEGENETKVKSNEVRHWLLTG